MTYTKGNEKSQLTLLKNDKVFNRIFKEIVIGNKNIQEKDKEYILFNALVIFKYYDNDNRYKSYFKLAYYIILKYSLLFNDYRPLYNLSMQIGFYPICKLIIKKKLKPLNSIPEIISQEIIELKFKNEREKYIETYEQNKSIKNLINNPKKKLAYIAPTSFGKSALIKDFISTEEFNKIGIIVPSKSLLIQTYKDIKELKLPYKMLLHDEMYNENKKFIGILTQERALRLLKRGTYFDVLFIDEAHNLLKYNQDNFRGILLARLIKINRIKNPNHKLIYLSPLVEDTKNLLIENEDNIFTTRIEHNLKSEDIHLFEKNKSYTYNRFTNEYYLINSNINYFEYIISNSLSKNFIYNFKPIHIESLAKELYNNLGSIELTSDLNRIKKTLENEVHNMFNANMYIDRGIIYIHGKIPNIIKEYLEYKFKKIKELRYIIANNVILEGINLPIDKLFITSTNYLKGKELTNLIGRVNRLNYIFSEGRLDKLNPNIHFLAHNVYQGVYSVRNKIELLRNHSFTDRIENPILFKYDINKLDISKDDKYSKEENIERRKKRDLRINLNTDFILHNDDNYSFDDEVKKYLIENSINIIYDDFNKVSKIISDRILDYRKDTDFMNLDIIDKIYRLFISGVEKNVIDFEVERLKNQKARNYYKFYLEKTQKQPLNRNIKETTNYFKKKAKSSDTYLFIGNAFGKVKRPSAKYNSNKYLSKVYIDLYGKKEKALVNLAVIKLKIEEDFVNFKINKLIICLHDFNLISDSEFNLHIYGTEDKSLINLAKMGLNVNLITKLIEDKQFVNIRIDSYGNLKVNPEFREYLRNQPELFKFEINKYI